MLDQLISLDAALMKEKNHSYNAFEAWTYTPKQKEYTDIIINSIVFLLTIKKGILSTWGSLKGADAYDRELAVISSAGRRDKLWGVLGDLKRVGVPVDTKRIEELLYGIDKVVEGQQNFLFSELISDCLSRFYTYGLKYCVCLKYDMEKTLI